MTINDTARYRDTMMHLQKKRNWVWKETLRIHKVAPETRVASALSAVEIFVCLYYGNILKYDPGNENWEGRDRFIISKGHGAVSLYPILADNGFIEMEELTTVCREGSRLGGIPDCVIPGFEPINGSLGHGLGVASGMALGLKSKGRNEKVFVLLGDGELYEGAVWEAIMFAGEHRLDNLILILDNNKICMLDYCNKVINLGRLDEKFRAFNWEVDTVDGHEISGLYDSLLAMKNNACAKPKLLIANTVKGKGVPSLETDPLCHIRSLSAQDVDDLIARCG